MKWPLPGSFVLTLTLAILGLGLGWQVYREVDRPVPGMGAADPAVFIRSIGQAQAFALKKVTAALPPIESFREITLRPLFNPTRRPVADEEPASVFKRDQLNVMLSGIVIDRTQQIAHLRSTRDWRVQAVSVGDVFEGWRIVSIEPDRVVLRSGAQVETVYMQKPRSGATPGRPTQPSSSRHKH